MARASIVSIHFTDEKAGPLRVVERAELVAGKGIVGDRYFNKTGTFSKKRTEDRQLTLIEEEALVAAKRDYDVDVRGEQTRRNMVTRGVALNHLVGRRFSIGGAVVEGIELCEPCGHLAKLFGSTRVRDALVHRGGLRCRIVEGATVRVGDPIVVD